MPIMTFLMAIGSNWQSVIGQLLASGGALLCGHQDIGLRTRVSSTFWFFIAIACSISALVTAIRAQIQYAAAFCAAVLFSETLLILRWTLRSRRNRNSQ